MGTALKTLAAGCALTGAFALGAGAAHAETPIRDVDYAEEDAAISGDLDGDQTIDIEVTAEDPYGRAGAGDDTTGDITNPEEPNEISLPEYIVGPVSATDGSDFHISYDAAGG